MAERQNRPAPEERVRNADMRAMESSRIASLRDQLHKIESSSNEEAKERIKKEIKDIEDEQKRREEDFRNRDRRDAA